MRIFLDKLTTTDDIVSLSLVVSAVKLEINRAEWIEFIYDKSELRIDLYKSF